MMHSAVCSSVSVGVTRPPVEGPALLWGCCCCNARRAHHHTRECQQQQQQQQQLWFIRPAAAAAGGFGKLLSKKLDDEDTTRLLILRKTMGLDKPRVSWMMPTTRAAAGGGGESLFLAASAETSEEGINLNESFSRSENGRAEPRFKLGAAAMPSGGGGGDQSKNLVHVLHETARVLQSALEEQKALTRGSWFAQKWLGFDRNAWMKSLAYQVAVHSLLQAVEEIAARGEGRDRDTHIFVHRSLMRQSAPLRDSIRHQLSSRDPSVDDWLWLEQHPQAVASFVGFLEKDKRFTAVTSTGWEGVSASPSKASDVALLTLALYSSAAVMKLGSAAVSCPLFSSSLLDEIKRQMQKLPEFMSMEQVYMFSSSVGLKQEFLDIFGMRAADDQNWQESEREGQFWINLVQQLLRAALSREGFRSKLRSFDSVEVLERDLAMFGFFAALGRSTSAYLAAKGVRDSEESISSLLRYLEGGSVLFYAQLASVSTYQLFIEVVCEEMEWLPFYPGSPQMGAHEEHDNVKARISKAEKQAAIAVALQVCSMWVDSFVRHSSWVQQPQGIRSSTFLQKRSAFVPLRLSHSEDTELQSVEFAMKKLESLVKESETSGVACGREKLSAACSDLEKIRSLKREVEALEAALKSKAGLKARLVLKQQVRCSCGWLFLFNNAVNGLLKQENRVYDDKAAKLALEEAAAVSQEAEAFELLRRELAVLESRVRQSARQANADMPMSEDEWVGTLDKEVASSSLSTGLEDDFDTELAGAYGDIFSKSIEKLKDASTDAWRGTKLLGTDVGAAMVLLRRAILGQELTDREQKMLRRTLTDLASVIPIGFLMLLPVTAVGHAAILAAIQKYVPALIPSAYGPKRLDVLRRLEQVQHLEPETATTSDNQQRMIPPPRKTPPPRKAKRSSKQT
ncbi:unnamed protein product [Sphagnum jensenii]|uniref:LETM1-like protein n=1 Tax=Sphagnum jensenii TaxID=128206 RepID=A0ABP1BEF4_9BRYO